MRYTGPKELENSISPEDALINIRTQKAVEC